MTASPPHTASGSLPESSVHLFWSLTNRSEFGYLHACGVHGKNRPRYHHRGHRTCQSEPESFGRTLVSHPIGVVLITAQYTGNEDAVIAALFHDVLEDVSPDIYSVDRMRDEFGERVTEIVANVSEIKSEGGITRPWRARKEDYIQHLQLLDDTDSLIVGAAEKCPTINSMVTDFESVGEETMKSLQGLKIGCSLELRPTNQNS
ncbi:HD domain-containing protein [Gordonia polyisoprenivorans]|nr:MULTISPECIES: HD domain-containing protein [Gordonia]OPX06181.1 hypothetical protein B1964_28815 [Gordonia sp. i37]